MSSFLALILFAASVDAPTLLARADRVRGAWEEVVLTIQVTTRKPNAPPASGRFEVAAKGRDRSRIRFLEPSEAGKLFVSIGDDAFLLLPRTKNPIKIPKSHRLEGGFSAADISKTRFSEDYDAVVERADTLDGRSCRVLRLIAKKGRNPSYPVIRVWIDDKDQLYRKAVFLLASGRTAKETTFDSYRAYHGTLSLEKMTIVDALRSGTTVVDYLDYEKRSLSDALFDLTTARTASVDPSK